MQFAAHACACVCVSVCARMCMCAHTVHACAHTHTHAHTHSHLNILGHLKSLGVRACGWRPFTNSSMAFLVETSSDSDTSGVADLMYLCTRVCVRARVCFSVCMGPGPGFRVQGPAARHLRLRRHEQRRSSMQSMQSLLRVRAHTRSQAGTTGGCSRSRFRRTLT